MMRVLGIETSCDETGVAIYDDQLGLLSHQLYSQAALHAAYGGVVPELASRDHIRRVVPLIQATLRAVDPDKAGKIDAVAYTAGPGLLGALLVGACIGCALAFSWQVPAIAVHHMEGHLLAPMLETHKPTFPFVALLVSGGHTQLVRADGIGCYQLLGETLDDAAGEAFDKTAKLLGLRYPGGPRLERLAEQGVPDRFFFTRPLLQRPGLDFSFSGLKTAVAQTIRKVEPTEQNYADIAYAFQQSVVETLVVKCHRALLKTGLKRLVVAGGVSANTFLRQQLAQLMQQYGGEVFYPHPYLCTDNGAMIAYAGLMHLQQQGVDHIAKRLAVDIYPNGSFSSLAH